MERKRALLGAVPFRFRSVTLSPNSHSNTHERAIRYSNALSALKPSCSDSAQEASGASDPVFKERSIRRGGRAIVCVACVRPRRLSEQLNREETRRDETNANEHCGEEWSGSGVEWSDSVTADGPMRRAEQRRGIHNE